MNQTELKENLTLANATLNQVQGDPNWKCMDPVDDQVIFELPLRAFDAHQAMRLLRSVRKYELDAFNIGIRFGKKQYKNVFDQQLNELQEQNNALKVMNERLSTQLERHIVKGGSEK